MFSCDGWCCGQFAQRSLCAVTIQRAYRAFLFRKRNASMLAFVMGVHRRLGAKSPMRGLDRELICMIMYENALKHTQLPSHS